MTGYDKTAFDLGTMIKYYPRYAMWTQKMCLKNSKQKIVGIFIEHESKLKYICGSLHHTARTMKCLNLALSMDAGLNEEVFDREAKDCLVQVTPSPDRA